MQIWVRRAGPNYQEGLKNIKAVGQELGLSMHVFGPEMHVSGKQKEEGDIVTQPIRHC